MSGIRVLTAGQAAVFVAAVERRPRRGVGEADEDIACLVAVAVVAVPRDHADVAKGAHGGAAHKALAATRRPDDGGGAGAGGSAVDVVLVFTGGRDALTAEEIVVVPWKVA